MKRTAMLFVFTAPLLVLSACQSMMASEIGMPEKQWLRRTLVADLASDDGNERVWKSSGAFYHFKDGRLARVSQGVQQHDVTVRYQ